jgi:hypothetical protein
MMIWMRIKEIEMLTDAALLIRCRIIEQFILNY